MGSDSACASPRAAGDSNRHGRTTRETRPPSPRACPARRSLLARSGYHSRARSPRQRRTLRHCALRRPPCWLSTASRWMSNPIDSMLVATVATSPAITTIIATPSGLGWTCSGRPPSSAAMRLTKPQPDPLVGPSETPYRPSNSGASPSLPSADEHSSNGRRSDRRST